jgi:hypothetical protein
MQSDNRAPKPRPRKYDALYARPYVHHGVEKLQFFRIGTAFQTDTGFDLLLYLAPPANADGAMRIMVRPALDEDDPELPEVPSARSPVVERKRGAR